MPAFHLAQGAAYIVITAATGTIYTLLVWFIRLFIRLKIHPPFAWDDIHCAIATVFTVLNSSLILSQTAYGLGHPTNTLGPHDVETQRKLGWTAVLCYVQACCFSILSVTFLLVRVTRMTSQARPAYLVALATGLWNLITTTIILFQCRLPEPWRTRPHSRCIDIYSAWVFITTSRALIELCNVIIAAWLIWKLRMPIKPKISIIGMFALRLLVIPPALTRLQYLKVSWQAADWSYARINVQITTQVALHVSTILATIPCVKNFLLVFESGNLHPPTIHPQTQDSSGAGGRRISKRRSSLSTFRPTIALITNRATPGNNHSRRTRSEHDLLRVPTAIRPGPIHTLHMSSWSSAPGPLNGAPPPAPGQSVGLQTLQTISTAEHDPEDAKSASLERRRSVDSEDSRKGIKRTQSFTVRFPEMEGEGEGRRGALVRERSKRQGSEGSRWSSRQDEDAQVREVGRESV